METIRITGTPSVTEALLSQYEPKPKSEQKIDWDAIEKQIVWQKNRVAKNTKSFKLPPLPLHLSTIHLRDFIAARLLDFGMTLEDIVGQKDHFTSEVRQQIAFEAFMLGFPIDYIYTALKTTYHVVAYAIKNYCGDIRIQTVRERYGIGIYHRQVLRV